MADERVAALLEQLVELQKLAVERQQQSSAISERHFADVRERGERALQMQRTAMARQRLVLRIWLGLFVFILAAIAGLLIALTRYLP